MSDTSKKPSPEVTDSQDQPPAEAKLAYEPPRCDKKRSIHRVTLLSGMGVAGMGAISMTN